MPAGLAVGFGWETPGRSHRKKMQWRGFTPRPGNRPTCGFPVSAGRFFERIPGSGRVRQSARECRFEENRHAFDRTVNSQRCHIRVTNANGASGRLLN